MNLGGVRPSAQPRDVHAEVELGMLVEADAVVLDVVVAAHSKSLSNKN
jgi:hypothetical protein